MNVEAANHVRALVEHLDGDQRAYSLLARLLEVLDLPLAALVPPPPAAQQQQAPELPQEPMYAQPRAPATRSPR